MIQRLRHAVGWPSTIAQTRLNFQVSASLDHGETLFIVGDVAPLGGSIDIPPDPLDQSSNGIGLVTIPQLYPVWYNAELVAIPSGTTLKYRYAVCSGGKFLRWEKIPFPRTLEVSGGEMSIQDELDCVDLEEKDVKKEKLRIVPRLSTGQAFLDPHVSNRQRRGAKRSPITYSPPTIPEDESTFYSNTTTTNNNNIDTYLSSTFNVSLGSLSEESIQSPLHHSGMLGHSNQDTLATIKYKRARTASDENFRLDVGIDSTDGVIIVAYRLPVIITRKDDGTWHIDWDDDNLICPSYSKRGQGHWSGDQRETHRDSTSGRVTDLMRVTWVGTVPTNVAVPKEEEETLAKLLLRFNCVAVFLSEEMAMRYHKYSHGTLWPVFHNIVDVYGKLPTRWWNPHDQKLAWCTYTEVNRLFVDKVIELYNEGDLVWVHGLHLLVLPSFLSRRLPFANVGLFLHTPFPSSEIFRTISVRDELLRGMLSADHIGFHCYEYARHFLTCCRRILGLNFCPQPGGYVGVEYNGRLVAVTISHIGIQTTMIADLVYKPSVVQQIDAIHNRFKGGGKILIVGIDEVARLKGLPLKLLAFEEFIKTHKHMEDKVCFVQIGVINRDALVINPDLIEQCRTEMKELVERINKTYPREGESLITYMEVQGTKLEERLPWWAAADILLVTSIRDGINLNPFEFVYAQELVNKSGVVLLSEFSGSSRVLIGSMGINPWKRDEIVSAIERAISMPEEERRARHDKDVEYIKNNTTTSWAERVLVDLKRARRSSTEGEYLGYGLGLGFRMLEFNAGFRQLELDRVVRSYRTSFRRVLLFDYSGTLVPEEQHNFSKYYTPSVDLHDNKISTVSKRDIVFPSSSLVNSLRLLCSDPRNTVFVVSGKGKAELEQVLGNVKCLGIAAEHGYYYRWGDYSQGGTAAKLSSAQATSMGSHDWLCTQDSYDDSWKDLTHAIMDVYTQRTHGTYVERKGSALIWQYRDADPEFGQLQVKELQDQLNQVLEYFAVDVIMGKGYLEVRPEGVNKGVMVDKIISTLESSKDNSIDFILCIGDDSSDEFMFSYLEDNRSRPSLYTCTVGKKPSCAKFFVNDGDEVAEMLNALTKVSTTSNRNLSMNDLSSYNFGNSSVREKKDVATPLPKMGGNLKVSKLSMSMNALSSAAGLNQSTPFTLEQYFSNIQEEDDEAGGIFF